MRLQNWISTTTLLRLLVRPLRAIDASPNYAVKEFKGAREGTVGAWNDMTSEERLTLSITQV
jgi:hypothetical protein